MAKINGVEIKNLKSFFGREGLCYQGDVYLNGKKLGFWSQDFNGAMVDNYCFDETILDQACAAYKSGFPKDYDYLEYVDTETFLADLATMTEIEKDCKKHFKKGCKAVAYMTDGCNYAHFGLPKEMTEEEVRATFPAEVKQMEKEMFDFGDTMEIFIPGQFDIIVDYAHPVPEMFAMQ